MVRPAGARSGAAGGHGVVNDLHVQTVAAHLGRLAAGSDVVSADGFSTPVREDRGELRQFLLFVFSARQAAQPEYTWSGVLLE